MKQGSTLGGSLLVAGTATGAGMLALPIVTGEAGFVPSLVLFAVYWLFSLFTAFMFLEVNLAFDKPVNFATMAKKTLGAPGRLIAWGIYLLLLYCLIAAYLAGSSAFLPKESAPFIFLAIFGTLVAFNTKIVDHSNRFLMIGLVLGYGFLMMFGGRDVKLPLLQREAWGALWPAIPVIVTSFGFHIIIPTLTTYLQRDVVRIKRSLIYGSAMALVFYVFFELVMLGSLPLDMLREGNREGLSATQLFASGAMVYAGKFFAFFAITTSFLGVSLSLRDFLADGLKINKRLPLLVLTFLPPLAFVLFYPRAFIMALDFAGLFVALLLGIWPVLMVFRKRQMKLESPYRLFGGGGLLIATTIVYSVVIAIGFLL